MIPTFRQLAYAMILTTVVCITTSCERVAPVRTLPSWVRNVYVPMVQNSSTEPGLSHLATTAVQEIILADGRLAVTQKHQADLQVWVFIDGFDTIVDETDSDGIHEREEFIIRAKLRLLDPMDDPFNPSLAIADMGAIETSYVFSSDPRSTRYQPKQDAKRVALQILGSQVLNELMVGFPEEWEDRGLLIGTSQRSDNVNRVRRRANPVSRGAVTY